MQGFKSFAHLYLHQKLAFLLVIRNASTCLPGRRNFALTILWSDPMWKVFKARQFLINFQNFILFRANIIIKSSLPFLEIRVDYARVSRFTKVYHKLPFVVRVLFVARVAHDSWDSLMAFFALRSHVTMRTIWVKFLV